MISFFSSIAPIFAIIAFLSWFGGEFSVLQKRLYLRGGPWRILRWVGVLLSIYGFFIYPKTFDPELVNYPLLIGTTAMLLGSARTKNRPENQIILG